MSVESSVPGTAGAAPSQTTTDTDRLWGALAYILDPIVSVLILVMEENKKRAFQRYHAIQALGFLAVVVVCYIIASILYCGLTTITGGILGCVMWVLYLVPAIPAIYYAYQSYQGKYFEIPVLTQFMRQQKWL